MYIQNPPALLLDQVERVYGDSCEIKPKHQKYNAISEDIIKRIYAGFDDRIIGQESVENETAESSLPPYG